MNISIVVPVFNEVENIPLLDQAIRDAMDDRAYEVIYVNDGSDDGSSEALKKLVGLDPEHNKVIEFRRNFGQTAALAAGIDHSTGEVIVTLDADLQNDPADIPQLIEKIDEAHS